MKSIGAMTQAELAAFIQSYLRKNEIYVTLSGRVALSIMPKRWKSFPKLMGYSDLQILRRHLAQTDQDFQAAHMQSGPVNSKL